MRKAIAAVILMGVVGFANAQTSPTKICLLAVDAAVSSKSAGYSQDKTNQLMEEQVYKNVQKASQKTMIEFTRSIVKVTYLGASESYMKQNICLK